MAELLHDTGSRVIILVHSMAKTHDSEIVRLVLRHVNILGNVLFATYLIKHLKASLVGTSVCWTPEASNA